MPITGFASGLNADLQDLVAQKFKERQQTHKEEMDRQDLALKQHEADIRASEHQMALREHQAMMDFNESQKTALGLQPGPVTEKTAASLDKGPFGYLVTRTPDQIPVKEGIDVSQLGGQARDPMQPSVAAPRQPDFGTPATPVTTGTQTLSTGGGLNYLAEKQKADERAAAAKLAAENKADADAKMEQFRRDLADQAQAGLNERAQERIAAETVRAREANDLKASLAQMRADMQTMNQPGQQLADSDIHHTASGTPYVDLSGYTGKSKDAARVEAHIRGAHPVSMRDAQKLDTIQGVRRQLETYQNTYLPKLATTVVGAPFQGVGNWVKGVSQWDEDLATMKKEWIGLVETLKGAVAGGGVRINQKEINSLMTDNAIHMNDTVGSAKKKIAYLIGLLDSEENGTLGTMSEPTVPSPPGGGGGAPAATAPTAAEPVQEWTRDAQGNPVPKK